MYIRFLKVQPMNKWNQKREIMRRYDLTARMYEMRYGEEQQIKYRAALERMNITHNSIILDIGCGSGLLFSHVATKVQTVVGVDISKKLLLQAKEHIHDFRNINLVQADADHLPFKENHFNYVFAFTVLQNLPKPMETLSEIKRNTRQDAIIVISGLKKTFSLKPFKELLENAGLQIVTLKDADELKCYLALAINRQL